MYVFGSYKIIKEILFIRENLEELPCIKLYIGANFDKLKKIVLTIIQKRN